MILKINTTDFMFVNYYDYLNETFNVNPFFLVYKSIAFPLILGNQFHFVQINRFLKVIY